MDHLHSAAASAALNLGFARLLQIAWAAGTIPILLVSLPIPGTGLLHRLLLGFAARGKIMQSSSRKFTVPQRFFLHFYVVAMVLTTCLALSTWFYAYREMVPLATEPLNYSTFVSHLMGGSDIFSFHKNLLTPVTHKYRVWRTVFVLLLLDAQILRRLHETINVFNYSPSARMHVFGYLTGLFFYIAAPLSLANTCLLEVVNYIRSQTVEFIVKGRERMPDLELHWWEFLRPLTNLGWCQWFGAAIFIWGWLHQLRCHAILGSLGKIKMGCISYLSIAMLLTSSLVLPPMLAATDRLAHDGERASDIPCLFFRGSEKCPPPPPPSPLKNDVGTTQQVCYYIRGELVCVGPPGPPPEDNRKP